MEHFNQAAGFSGEDLSALIMFLTVALLLIWSGWLISNSLQAMRDGALRGFDFGLRLMKVLVVYATALAFFNFLGGKS